MITATEISRTFITMTGPIEEVRGVGFHVDAGEMVGFLGPSGAGKPTTLRMSTALLRPTAVRTLPAWPATPCRRRAPPLGPDS